MELRLRDYQTRAVQGVLNGWGTFDRLLGVAATGAGKTVIAAHVIKARLGQGCCLFIAHREELLDQAMDKLWRILEMKIGLERSWSRAKFSDKVVVASIDSLHKARLERWPTEHFQTIIIDECHRSVTKKYQNVLDHFKSAKVLGITATPDREDQRSLNAVFEHIAFEVGLIELIQKEWLCPIVTEQIPLKIDLGSVGLREGDLDLMQTAHVLEPYLGALVAELAKIKQRKALVFLPLIKLSEQFAWIARASGLSAEHIDGESTDRKEILQRFKQGSTRVLSCAQLLTEGYDEPSVDCIVMMRPTQSGTFYRQCIGRGFRTCEGKENLLVLDPLWLSSVHPLVKPANLVAKTKEECDRITEILGAGGNLLEAKEVVRQMTMADIEERAKELAAELDRNSKKKRVLFDPLEAASTLANPDLADFQPIVHWHSQNVTPKQKSLLANWGVNPEHVQNRGQANAIISVLIRRHKRDLATFRQVRQLIRFNHPYPQTATFKQATAFLSRHLGDHRERETTNA